MLKIERRRRNGTGAEPADDPATAGDPGAAEPGTSAPPRLPGRRNPKWIALGVIAICLGALLSALIYGRVATESTVLVTTRTVYRGSVIAPGDLAPVTVGGASAGQAVPADQAADLVGQTAVYDLIAGSVIPVGAIGEVAVPAEGRALVGVRFVDGRAPAGQLHPGSSIRLIAIPPDAAAPDFADDYSGTAYTAIVVDTAAGPDGMSTLVNVDVAADQAATIALLSAQERLAVVRDHDGER